MKRFLMISTFLALSFLTYSQASLNPWAVRNLRQKTSFPESVGNSDSSRVILLSKGQSTLNKVYVFDLLGYKEWVGQLTQTSTSAPTAHILKNSLDGTITWARTGTGVYTGTLNGAFADSSKLVLVGTAFGDSSLLSIKRTSANVITITSSIGGVATDAILNRTPLIIRRYR